jgi:hypothetical protein
MPFCQLVVEKITCRTPTETGINDRDEVYFLVAGATTHGKKVRVSPKGPAADYYGLSKGDSAHYITLWQGDLEDGEDAFLIVFVREQDNAQLQAIKDAIGGAVTVITSIASQSPGGVAGGTAQLGQALFELSESLGSDADQTIGAFAVRIRSRAQHGDAVCEWGDVIDMVKVTTADLTAHFEAFGSKADYTLSVGLALPPGQDVLGAGFVSEPSGRVAEVDVVRLTRVPPPKGGGRVVTVSKNGSDRVELVAWDCEELGTQAKRRGDTSGERVDLLAATDCMGRVVTATTEKDTGKLKLTLWSVGQGHKAEIEDEFHSRDDLPKGVKELAVASYGESIVVAVRDAHTLLRVLAWHFVPPEEEQSPVGPHVEPGLHLIGDSFADPKHRERRIRAVAVACCGPRFVTAVREDQTNNLRVIAWEATPDGKIEQTGASVVGAGGPISDVSIVDVDDKRLVTAVRMHDGELKLIVWDILQNGKLVNHRYEDAPPSPRAVDDVAVTTFGPDIMLNEELAPVQVATAAVRHVGGKLRVTTWDLSDQGLLRRMTDIDFDPVREVALTSLGEGTWTTSVSRDSTPQYGLLAAVRDDHDELRLFGWRSAHDNVL